MLAPGWAFFLPSRFITQDYPSSAEMLLFFYPLGGSISHKVLCLGVLAETSTSSNESNKPSQLFTLPGITGDTSTGKTEGNWSARLRNASATP